MSKQTIYDQLIKAGCSPTGALALMGNWECESNLEGCRLQGDFQSDRWPSKEYARKVDNALVSDDWFYLDGKGWGIPQYTYWSRKKGFLEFCRKHSISIGNETANVDYALLELTTEYKSLWEFLTTCGEGQLYDAVGRVCKEYERPAYNNIQERYNAAQALKAEVFTPVEEPVKDADKPETFWPPRMLCVGMDGPDVTLLQALLLCHGYNTGGCSGIYDNRTRNMVLAFQAENNLDVDGIAGPKTFKALGVVV